MREFDTRLHLACSRPPLTSAKSARAASFKHRVLHSSLLSSCASSPYFYHPCTNTRCCVGPPGPMAAELGLAPALLRPRAPAEPVVAAKFHQGSPWAPAGAEAADGARRLEAEATVSSLSCFSSRLCWSMCFFEFTQLRIVARNVLLKLSAKALPPARSLQTRPGQEC